MAQAMHYLLCMNAYEIAVLVEQALAEMDGARIQSYDIKLSPEGNFYIEAAVDGRKFRIYISYIEEVSE